MCCASPLASRASWARPGLDTTNNDFLLHPPRPDVTGDRKVSSAFAEVMIPLVNEDAQIALLNRLELNLSARSERYSDFGSTTKPKIGLNWKPAEWLMLRASYNEGFMAPSLAALYTSPRWTISAGAGDTDPYRNPALNEGPYVMRTYFGGNPDLKPQESEGDTWGFVIDVPFVAGLSVNADWWRIRRSDLLGQRSVAPTVNNLLFASGAAEWRSTSNIFWRKDQWHAGLGIYHVGETHDSGATTTQAIYDSLGQPSDIEPFFTQGRTIYRRVVDSFVTYNLSVGYAFDGGSHDLLRDTRVRFGLINLTDEEPPLAAESFGYDPSVSQSLLSGRSWNLQITKRF